ncbi:uncharacterized protein EV154DRAFT_479784 [Mucor mucedo]|uniref:uncharacterized protein n=1 Tax=Mucor mucedo TaxID=29922 RepID=UPI002220E21F|nr:uncharacterized protein EV154DRAFT_479784 [Mucor mucedo]KAI7892877.1 hypothetical protein EV154DRAFT_479784 [Mucor mucedo]
MITNNNIAEQRHYIQKQRRAFVRDDILDQGYKNAETSLANDTNSVDRTEVPEEQESPRQKKRKSFSGVTREGHSRQRRHQREKLLVYWRSILHFSNALEHLSSTSCRVNKLNLSITITKIIDSTIMHTTFKEVSIPVPEKSGGAIADYISVVMSLMRTIVKNIDIIETILQIIHEDNLNFLAPNVSLVYESDSDSSTDSTISTSSNSREEARI